jgi:predicted phage replisome organizer
MPDIYWIKLAVCMFDDEKITVISSRSDGDSMLMVWIGLLCLAGKVNDSGLIYLSQGVPYTEETLATVFHKPQSLIRQALEAFIGLGMVTLHGNGTLEIVNWTKHQNVDGMERQREKTRLRVEKCRNKQKQLTCNATVTLRNALESESEKNKKERIPVDKQPAPKKVREKKPVPEGYADFNDELFALHEKKTGAAYCFTGKDGEAVKRVLAAIGKDKAIEKLRAYYSDDTLWFTKTGRSVSSFAQHVNEIGNGTGESYIEREVRKTRAMVAAMDAKKAAAT